MLSGMKDSYSYNDVQIVAHTAAMTALCEVVRMVDEGYDTKYIRDVAFQCMLLNQRSIREAEGDQILQGL